MTVAETGNRFGSVFQFAEYRSRPAGITIYRAAMALLRTAIHRDALAPVLGLDDPEPVYLAHELYHHLDAAEPVSIARAVLVTTVAYPACMEMMRERPTPNPIPMSPPTNEIITASVRN